MLNMRLRSESGIKAMLMYVFEDIKIDSEVLGAGVLDKSNPRLSRLPLNIGSRMTEEVNLCIDFPNEVAPEKADEEIPLQFYLEFADRTIEIDVEGYFPKR